MSTLPIGRHAWSRFFAIPMIKTNSNAVNKTHGTTSWTGEEWFDWFLLLSTINESFEIVRIVDVVSYGFVVFMFFRTAMPIQAPQWTDFLACPVCCNGFDAETRHPISLGCAHTVCRSCLSNLPKKQCPFDQVSAYIIGCLSVITNIINNFHSLMSDSSFQTVNVLLVIRLVQ